MDEHLDTIKFPQKGFIDPVMNPLIDHWSHFRCGSYTSEWVSRAVGIVNTPSNFLLRGPVWFDLFRPIVPSDMRKLFRAKGMTTIELNLSELGLDEKLNWIRNEIITKRRPPVLLIRTATLHWIAVGGYDDAQRLFYIYDARIGSDSYDPDLPIGNATISYNELLFLWSGRFIWHYVAIVVTHVTVHDDGKNKTEKLLEAFSNGDFVGRDKTSENALRSFR